MYYSRESLKILGIRFPYNRKLKREKIIDCHIVKTENVLRLWKIRDWSIEGKIKIFNILAISKKYILV